ncbi:hypothetical protein HY383_02520 [Candidatus Daviesbacteria bacterium]|nr:hypothetical protein [Candidatus Daviesbacteria bacterium]
MRHSFYDDPLYKKQQAEITRKYWQLGKFDFKRKSENRICQNPQCSRPFTTKPHEKKKYCSHACATSFSNKERTTSLSSEKLSKLYASGQSITDIAKHLCISSNKVVYWMNKYRIQRRSISDAVYLKNHPNGDPFSFRTPSSLAESMLLGLGLGLYWGESNKLNKTSIRLGNTDPDLMNYFIKFMIDICGVKKQDLKFGLQIFTDIDTQTAMNYWMEELDIKKEQFYKPIITKSNSLGTYRKKSKYGVIMLNYHNRKLRDLLVGMLPTWLSGRARSW